MVETKSCCSSSNLVSLRRLVNPIIELSGVRIS
jgi:hypothetical protein